MPFRHNQAAIRILLNINYKYPVNFMENSMESLWKKKRKRSKTYPK
jgi:hypothetical protein